ncbi:MAG TPA: hypothetical protein VFG64_03960 [Dongiaceae bacterium]|nr:hypothetical protein [Dongiaceae bacterium]
MQEIPRALLLPPPSPQRPGMRVAESDSDSTLRAARRQHGAAPGGGQAFLTLVGSEREDSVELKGKQFRFKPYSSRGASADGVRTPDEAGSAGEAASGEESSDSEIVLDGFGLGAQQRNSSAFIASVIAQQHPRQGLYNPRHEAASDAYRRAGGSPSAVDNQPRVVSFAV